MCSCRSSPSTPGRTGSIAATSWPTSRTRPLSLQGRSRAGIPDGVKVLRVQPQDHPPRGQQDDALTPAKGPDAMTYTCHGSQFGRPAPRSLPARRRFVALLDVLGMRSWLERVTPDKIASALDSAIGEAVTGLASSGGRIVAENRTLTITITAAGPQPASSGPLQTESYGPLVGVAHFSDTLLAWAPDDSWASLSVLSSTVTSLLSVALREGIPMRGAIAVGDVVCAPKEQRFVGMPIADAYVWAEKDCPYRCVGVSFTPVTLELLRSMLPEVPAWCAADFPKQVIETSECVAAGNVAWFGATLMLNHWDASFRAGGRERVLAKGKKRIEEILSHPERMPPGEPERRAVRCKIAQTQEFHAIVVNAACVPEMRAPTAATSDAHWAEMLRLNQLMLAER